MEGKVEKQIHYGQLVSVNLLTESLRKTECLCLNCGKINTDPKLNCPIAQRLFGACIDGGVALMVTRCRDFSLHITA